VEFEVSLLSSNPARYVFEAGISATANVIPKLRKRKDFGTENIMLKFSTACKFSRCVRVVLLIEQNTM